MLASFASQIQKAKLQLCLLSIWPKILGFFLGSWHFNTVAEIMEKQLSLCNWLYRHAKKQKQVYFSYDSVKMLKIALKDGAASSSTNFEVLRGVIQKLRFQL